MTDATTGTAAGTTRAARMETLLRDAFAPAALGIIDDSARHAGHAGATPGGETHYTVRIVSDLFTGLSRVDRSRAVHQALGSEFASGLHALSLELRSPSEGLSKNP
jgi:BolA family transcriptional regulator, general stress-responsive regulator